LEHSEPDLGAGETREGQLERELAGGDKEARLKFCQGFLAKTRTLTQLPLNPDKPETPDFGASRGEKHQI